MAGGLIVTGLFALNTDDIFFEVNIGFFLDQNSAY